MFDQASGKIHQQPVASSDAAQTCSPDRTEGEVRMTRPAGQSRRVLSLFSGAGGLDEGLRQAGWDILAQVEMDADCAKTLELQAKRLGEATQVLNRRVEDIDPRQLRLDLGLRRGSLPLLAGGPPCQPFTTSGRRRGLTDQRATTLFPTYLRWVDEFSPRALLIENVDGMLSNALQHRPLIERGLGWPRDAPPEEQKGSFLKWLLDELRTRGYSVAWGLAEAADYGVPQLRQRAIVIAVKGSTPCWLPLPTHGQTGLPPYRTLRHALDGIDGHIGPIMPLSARKKDVYRRIPAGGNWRDLPEDLRKSTMGKAYVATGGKSGWWRRLRWDAPSPTILGMPDHSSTSLIHPDEVRCLSVRECAVLQSFPPDVEFAGKPRSQYQQVGNAVPPLLGEALGRAIDEFLRGERQETPQIPEWRKLSANRRPGTHGWSTKAGYKIVVPVRPDHVWARVDSGAIEK